jgi:hypothetical protein
MSGNYQSWNEDSPGGLAETAAAVAAGLAEASAGYAITAVETRELLTAHGPTVITHSPVGEPGRQGDPDVGLPDAADY